MRRKLLWLLMSCLIAAALVVTSCRPAEKEKEEVIIPEPEEPAHEETFSVGETVEPDSLAVPVTQKLAVTITEIQMTDSYEYYRVMDERWETSEAPLGKIYVIAFVKIKNVSDTDTFKAGTLWMRGGWAEEHIPSTFYMAESPLEPGWPLEPGEELEGYVKFIAPKDSTGYHVRYRFSEDPDVWAIWLVE